jgi:hypothetical protein
LEKAPLEVLAYILAESSSAPARNKIRAFLQKWRPLRMDLQSVANELQNIGMARGPKFDKVLEDFFGAQLSGRAKTPEDRTKLLRKLSGIKEPPPKKIKEVKKKGGAGVEAKVEAKETGKPTAGKAATVAPKPAAPPAKGHKPAKAGGGKKPTSKKSKPAKKARTAAKKKKR